MLHYPMGPFHFRDDIFRGSSEVTLFFVTPAKAGVYKPYSIGILDSRLRGNDVFVSFRNFLFEDLGLALKNVELCDIIY